MRCEATSTEPTYMVYISEKLGIKKGLEFSFPICCDFPFGGIGREIE